MIRRRKFQVKPNMSLSIAHSSSSKTPNIASPEVVSIPNISEAVEEITPPELDAGTLKQFPADPPNYSAEREIDDGCPQICLTDTIDVTPSSSSYVSTSAIKSPNHTPQYPPTTKNNDHLSRPVQILNNSSAHDLKGKRSFESRNCNDSNDQSTKEPSKKLPKRTECELDSTSFKMSDLIRWKPKSENTLRTKVNIKKKQLRQSLNGITSQPPASEQPETIGPRVKINENGEMVVDEESLVVVGDPESKTWETINDELVPKKLNSMSFRKTRRSTSWSVRETDLFFDVLAASGTDFGLMHEFIPMRSRAELKKKFNREEKANLRRVNEVLRKPVLLNEEFKKRIAELVESLEEDASIEEDPDE